jgi:hypothetical protein
MPTDYSERVYAGVLGKIIGVYLGRPFEQWSHQRIVSELGEITGYLHEKLKVPLIVSDDDITGTFTFARALADNDFDPALTAKQIGQGWLNYIIETILATKRFDQRLEQKYSLGLEVRGSMIRATIDGQIIFEFEDADHPLLAGGIGIVCEEGNIQSGAVAISTV